MTANCRHSPCYLLMVLALLLTGSQVPAVEIIDARDLHGQQASDQPVTGFYSVTPEGETRPIDPVESGLATAGSTDLSPEDGEPPQPSTDTQESRTQKSSKKKTGQDKPRKVRIRIKRKPPERSLADQFQCERHGFYYTNDGRCILPAYGHLPVIPHLLPSPGVPPMVGD